MLPVMESPEPKTLIDQAFALLAEHPGFASRPDQAHLALLISDCVETGDSGAFEAPTGLGKSLAALIPAIAHAIADGKRVVVATYTNVLAEQYWFKDLPLALSLFDEARWPKTQLLMGRQRYACLAEIKGQRELVTPNLDLGIESEFRNRYRGPRGRITDHWKKISAPPVCPSRLCPHYEACHYYRARRGAERAGVVITNHAVVLQDAQLRSSTDGEMTLLGEYDFLILDEAHDFLHAAQNALEFEVTPSRLDLILSLAEKIDQGVMPVALNTERLDGWLHISERFRDQVLTAKDKLQMEIHGSGILAAAPPELQQFPSVKQVLVEAPRPAVVEVCDLLADSVKAFVQGLDDLAENCKAEDESGKLAFETIRNYRVFIQEFGLGCIHVLTPPDVSVAHLSTQFTPIVRSDTIDLAGPLRELIWDQGPVVSMSATLALDGTFEFFQRTTGATFAHEEILPSPFDYSTQSALYLPKAGTILDPTVARRENREAEYIGSVARELKSIIETFEGRTLALFHSRRDMEAVAEQVDLPASLPILVQRTSGSAQQGELFKADPHTSLFALRSFWTGFDAPGDTLMCVALVRMPFEVPVDPLVIARNSWLQLQGRDPFHEHSLSLVKMMLRQGAGRLIRTADDRGVIALLDSRIRTKNYGEALLANLPPSMHVFDDIREAAARIGFSPSDTDLSNLLRRSIR